MYQVQKLLIGKVESSEENSGFLNRLFKGKHHCKGMSGIIEEGNKIMSEDINPDVMDAAIIAAAQKIEHYEICGYGTARAYAEELGKRDIEKLLLQTLDEEYEADRHLTDLAVGRLNREAETAGNNENGDGRRYNSGAGRASNKTTSRNSASASKKKSNSKSSASKKSKSSVSQATKSANSTSKSGSKAGASKKAASKSGSKTSSKKSSSRTTTSRKK